MSSGLLLLADGRLPTGGHAHSAGVEAAVRVGDVHDTATLTRYLTARLATTGRVDAAFAAAACAAVGGTGDRARVAERLAVLDAEYSARQPSPYLRGVSRQLGRQLLRTVRDVWPHRALDDLADGPGDPHQAIALGAAAAAAGATPEDAAGLAIHHLAGAVVSGAVRLLGLDPTELVAIQAREVGAALAATVDVDPTGPAADLPAAGSTLSEILGEHHGSLDARLFVA